MRIDKAIAEFLSWGPETQAFVVDLYHRMETDPKQEGCETLAQEVQRDRREVQQKPKVRPWTLEDRKFIAADFRINRRMTLAIAERLAEKHDRTPAAVKIQFHIYCTSPESFESQAWDVRGVWTDDEDVIARDLLQEFLRQGIKFSSNHALVVEAANVLGRSPVSVYTRLYKLWQDGNKQ